MPVNHWLNALQVLAKITFEYYSGGKVKQQLFSTDHWPGNDPWSVFGLPNRYQTGLNLFG
jgi:hypothetical protein